MPYSAGGRWVPAPGQSYWPRAHPGAEPMPMGPRGTPPPAVPAATPAPLTVTTGTQWIESPLSGSRALNVGGRRFRVPRDAEIKQSRRAGVVWVRTEGVTYILSELGVLQQTDAERRATRFDLL